VDTGGVAKRKVESRTGSSTGVGTTTSRRSNSVGTFASSISALRRNNTKGLSQ